jgi:anti-anti-sigma factor
LSLEQNIDYSIKDKSLIFQIPNRIDIEVSRRYLIVLETVLNSNHIEHLILTTDDNFSISSMGFGFMMQIYKFCEKFKCDLRVVCTTESNKDMFDKLKMGHILRVFDSIDEARTSKM